MARAHTHEADCNSPVPRYSSALLLLAITGLLVACGGGGGGGGEQAAGGGSPNTATLAWDPVNDPDLAGYRIYYRTAPGSYLQSLGQGLDVDKFTTTYIVTGLSSGTTYCFAATAYGGSNNESDFSNEVCKTVS